MSNGVVDGERREDLELGASVGDGVKEGVRASFRAESRARV